VASVGTGVQLASAHHSSPHEGGTRGCAVSAAALGIGSQALGRGTRSGLQHNQHVTAGALRSGRLAPNLMKAVDVFLLI